VLLNEPIDALDRVRAHGWQTSTDYDSDTFTIAPCVCW